MPANKLSKGISLHYGSVCRHVAVTLRPKVGSQHLVVTKQRVKRQAKIAIGNVFVTMERRASLPAVSNPFS